MNVRFSFSVMKLIQAFILSFGYAAVMFASCSKEMSLRGVAVKTAVTVDNSLVAGQLVLTSALFAQLCAPLDHVGQHFRDCVAAAEDLREVMV